MENASKALIMSGSILIGVLLVALMVYLFTSASAMRKSYSTNISNTRMNEFNTKYTKYLVTSEEYKESGNYVTIRDIITLANNAEEFNEELDENSNDFISICVNDIRINNADKNENDLLKDNISNKYVCTAVEYNQSSGRVKKISFRNTRPDEDRPAESNNTE